MSSSQVAIDASLLVALLNPRDLWRSQALTLEHALLGAHVTPVYFDCVVAETISAAARRLHEKGCAAEVEGLLVRLSDRVSHDALTWILPDVPRLYNQVLELIRTSRGELNFNDALIALACRERGIPTIASFDPDFERIPWLKRVAAPSDVSNGTGT